MSAPIPTARHRTPTGWSDDRLRQAYDLIWEAWRAHRTPDDKLPELVTILTDLEAADHLIAALIEERAA